MIAEFQFVDVGLAKFRTFVAAKKRLDPEGYAHSEMGFGADPEDAIADLVKNLDAKGVETEGLEARITAETGLDIFRQEPKASDVESDDESYFVGLRWN
jgi:hypothetical protein